MHLSTLIDNANSAVTQIQVVHAATLAKLMARDDFTMEQKMALIELLKPVADTISVAQSKFTIDS